MAYKVLYVGTFSLPDLDAASIRVMGNAYQLRKNGIEVVFLDKQKDASEIIVESRRIVNGFTSYSVPIKKNKLINYFQNEFVVREFAKVLELEKPDAVIAYNYPSIALNKIRKLCKNNNIIIISDCTEWYSSRNYKFPFSLLCAIDTFFRMRFVNKRINNIILVSSYLERYYSKSHVIRVPFLVNIDEFPHESNDLLFSSNKINVIYSGSPSLSKESLLTIVKAIMLCKNRNNISFRVAGLTKEQFLLGQHKNKRIGKMLDSIDISFLGKIERSSNLRMIKNSDVFIFHRDRTRQNMAGFPTKFVECVTMGVPVITTDTSDLMDISKNNDLSVFFYHNLHELVDILSRKISFFKELRTHPRNTNLFDFKRNDNLANWILELFD